MSGLNERMTDRVLETRECRGAASRGGKMGMVSWSKMSVGDRIMVQDDGRCSFPRRLPAAADITHSRRWQEGRASHSGHLQPSTEHRNDQGSWLHRTCSSEFLRLARDTITEQPFNRSLQISFSVVVLRVARTPHSRPALVSQIALGWWLPRQLGGRNGTGSNGGVLFQSHYLSCPREQVTHRVRQDRQKQIG